MERFQKIFFISFLSLLSWTISVEAIEVYLKNGDKITGVIIQETDQEIVLKTLGAGEIKLDKAFIDREKTYPEEYAMPNTDTQQQKTSEEKRLQQAADKEKVKWEKTFYLGYTQSGGNTKKAQGMVS